MQREKNIDWISDLRVIAAVAVITIHVAMDCRAMDVLYADLLYDGFARFSVPVFVMISGALLLPREYSLADFTKNWFKKIVIPFLFWSIPYVIHNLYERSNRGETFTVLQGFKEGFKYIKQGTTSFHLWYIYMIIGIYLFIPIIGKWVRNSSEKELRYFLIIWFCALLFQLPALSFLQPPFDLYYFSGYLGFLVLGYYLSTKSNYTLLQAIMLLLTGYLITIGGTYYLSLINNEFTHTYYDYLRPNIALLSAGIFLLIKKINGRLFVNSKLKMLRDSVAKHSYGIYLAHWLVIVGLNKVGIGWWFITPLIGIPITVLCCLMISFCVVWTLNKLPFGKYVSG